MDHHDKKDMGKAILLFIAACIFCGWLALGGASDLIQKLSEGQ